MGPGGWDQLVPPTGKEALDNFIPVASIPHLITRR